MIRPELKELKSLTEGRHVIHSVEESVQFSRDLGTYVHRKGEKDPNFKIKCSVSSEGGIAMEWSQILDDIMGFGEQLHLRFHEEPIWGSDKTEWHMSFTLNIHNRKIGVNPFAKLTVEDMKKVITACKELIKCAEDLLTYTRTEGKR